MLLRQPCLGGRARAHALATKLEEHDVAPVEAPSRQAVEPGLLCVSAARAHSFLPHLSWQLTTHNETCEYVGQVAAQKDATSTASDNARIVIGLCPPSRAMTPPRFKKSELPVSRAGARAHEWRRSGRGASGRSRAPERDECARTRRCAKFAKRHARPVFSNCPPGYVCARCGRDFRRRR